MNGPGRYIVARHGNSGPFLLVDLWSGHKLSSLHGNATLHAAPYDLTRSGTLATVDPEGRHVAMLTPSGFALWDARSGRPVGAPVVFPTEGGQGGELIFPNAAAFSPDGKEVAVSRSNGTIVRYAVPSLRPIGDAISASDGLLAYQPNGSMLAATNGNAVDLIDLSLGQVIATIPLADGLQDNHAYAFEPTVQFDTSGRTFLTTGWTDSHPALVWSTVPSDWVRTACRIAGRNLTQAEWTQLVGNDVPYHRTCPQWPAGS
jgi:hypothetical protein